jgi:tetratricopeptide (TPR) repeat protein
MTLHPVKQIDVQHAVQQEQLTQQAHAFNARARQAMEVGDYQAAYTAFGEELRIWRTLDNIHEIIYALFHQAWVLRYGLGDSKTARPLLEESLRLAQQMGTPRYVHPALINLGDLALDEGEYGTAEALLKQSLAMFRDLGLMDLVLDIVLVLEGCAAAAAGLQQPERSLRLYGATTAIRAAVPAVLDLPAIQTRLSRLLMPARLALSVEAAAVAEASGRAFTLEQAITYALDNVFPT